MGWIKNRILAEQRKYKKLDMDWARLAEVKIMSTIKEAIQESKESYDHMKDTNWTDNMAVNLIETLKLEKKK